MFLPLALLAIPLAISPVLKLPSKSIRFATPVLTKAGNAKVFGAGLSTFAVSARVPTPWWIARSDPR
jgi:hypothetical protein